MTMADILAAAKADALRQLFGSGHEATAEAESTPSKKRRPRTGSNRKDGDKNPDGAMGADAEIISAPAVPELSDTEKEKYSEIIEAMKRFSERGNDGNGEIEAETANAVQTSDDAEAKPPYTGDIDGEKTIKTRSAKKSGNDQSSTPKSRREKKQEARNQIARLKALAERPEVVDAWDVSGSDPLLLVHLKSRPNSVPVPSNWSQKRKYLQNKRGMEKRIFQLPSFIAETGIGALRDAQLEADEKKTLKQKQREKMRAKTGKGVEVDEMVMHDAFFKFQTKPRLSAHGDLYYELRELEVDHSTFKPGHISSTLRAALGVGADDPPPWLINMQRYGPPPGYPNLKIPGLNAPIPMGAKFGYHPGGWGKPPVDETGQPIYGDVFGEGREYRVRDARFDVLDAIKRDLWGELKAGKEFFKSVRDEEADKEEEENGKDSKSAEAEDRGSAVTAVSGAAGTSSVQIPALDTPVDGIELRKGVPAGALYAVLPEKRASVGKGDMLGSSHVYDLAGGSAAGAVGDDMNGKQKEQDGSRGVDGNETEKGGAAAHERSERKRKTFGNDGERLAKMQKSFKF